MAIGEIGLDYHWNRSPRDEQLQAFEAQLELARSMGLPVVIHNRDAHDDTMAVLQNWAADASWPDRPIGVMHCYSGDVAMAERLMAAGFLISLAGNVTFPKAVELHEVAKALPLDKLVLETDAPYLAPQPRRGKRNEPAHVRMTAEFVADLRGEPLEEIGRVTSHNAASSFRWNGATCVSQHLRFARPDPTAGGAGPRARRSRTSRVASAETSPALRFRRRSPARVGVRKRRQAHPSGPGVRGGRLGKADPAAVRTWRLRSRRCTLPRSCMTISSMDRSFVAACPP